MYLFLWLKSYCSSISILCPPNISTKIWTVLDLFVEAQAFHIFNHLIHWKCISYEPCIWRIQCWSNIIGVEETLDPLSKVFQSVSHGIGVSIDTRGSIREIIKSFHCNIIVTWQKKEGFVALNQSLERQRKNQEDAMNGQTRGWWYLLLGI